MKEKEALYRSLKPKVRYYTQQWLYGLGWCDGAGVNRTLNAAFRNKEHMAKQFPCRRFRILKETTEVVG